jgi:nitrite reductase/ring-hydroxylating ferredoxin subunit
VTLDPQLHRFVYAAFPRMKYIARLERLVARYQLALADGDRIAAASGSAVPNRDPMAGAKNTLRLLMEHPSALQEMSALDPEKIAARLEAARRELSNLRAAAPLPPPPERADRTLALAFADIEYLMLELRLVKRMLRRMPPIPLVEQYLSSRKDPLEGLDADTVRVIGKLPRGSLLKTAAAISGLRYGIDDLYQRLVPQKPKAAQGPVVYACPSSEVREGCGVKVEAFGRNLALFRDAGQLHAIDDHCPHRGGPLHQGDIENGAAICPLHGWAFDLQTGHMRGNPRVRVAVYSVEQRGDDLYVGPAVPTASNTEP